MTLLAQKSALAAAIFFGAACLAPAGAQTAAPPPVAAPAAPQLSQAHLDLAIEVIKLSGMSRSIDLIVPDMVMKARRLFAQTRPEIAAEVEKSIGTLQPEFDAEMTEALKIAGLAYGSRLSEAELKEVAAFFKSPVGSKYVASQPVILDQMFRDLDQFTNRLSNTVVEKLIADMKKRGIQF